MFNNFVGAKVCFISELTKHYVKNILIPII